MTTRKREPLNRKMALSKIELISGVVIAVVLIGAFISWSASYQVKSKTSEAKTNLELIFDAEVSYYKKSQPEDTNPESISPNRRVFLPLSAQPTQPGPSKQQADFTHGDWALLNIKINDPVYYSYSVETKGEGNGATFNVIARGDLNGDGHFSRWEIAGRVNPKGEVLGRNQIYSLDPLE